MKASLLGFIVGPDVFISCTDSQFDIAIDEMKAKQAKSMESKLFMFNPRYKIYKLRYGGTKNLMTTFFALALKKTTLKSHLKILLQT